MIKFYRIRKLAITTSVLPLTACSISSILPEPGPADIVYRLSANNVTVVTPNADAALLRIDRPAMSKAISGHDIVVSPDGRRLAVAEQSRWAEPLPDLVQDALLDVLAGRKSMVGVLPTSGARTPYRIHLTVRNFESTFDNGPGSAPLATVHFAATLSNASTRDLLGTYDVRKTQRASSFQVSSIVEAQDVANRAALNELADWMETVLLNFPS